MLKGLLFGLRFKNAGHEVKLLALVDSGSDYCVFPATLIVNLNFSAPVGVMQMCRSEPGDFLIAARRERSDVQRRIWSMSVLRSQSVPEWKL
jgi:hypothetical protein